MAPQYAVSDSGTLVYIPGTAAMLHQLSRTLVWVDRKGKEEPLAAPPNDYTDSQNISRWNKSGLDRLCRIADNTDIWIWDLVRKTMTRLTFDENLVTCPLWTPDGKRIAFFPVASQVEQLGVYWKAADGTGEDEKLGSVSDRDVLCHGLGQATEKPWSWQ